jgi:hypothetical protein
LSYNDIHVINKNFYYHQNFKEQIEDEFNRTLNEFEHIEPFNRPLLPKQQSSKKFFAMIEILNQFILPKFVNNTTSFKKLHSIIYSGALTIIRLKGSKEIGQTNNIKAKELPTWEQRLNKRINNIRRDLGRIIQYLKGINSNHLNNCIQFILNNNRIHCLKYNEYNKTLIEIKDTLLQKLNIYSKRLKRYKNNKQRKFENKLFRNNEKLFYKNLTDNKTQTNNGTPNINEIKEFWSNIWSNGVQFNNQAEWIPHLENDIKLNGNNLIKAVNTYAVPLLTNSFGVIKWSKTNLQNINIKTKVLFTKFSKHHPKSAIERFNLPRENGGRGFSNLEILLHNQIASLKNYFLNRARDNTFFNTLVSADKGYTPLNLSDNIISDIVKPNIPDTIANIKQKSLHGRYFKELEQPEVNIQASHHRPITN